MTTDHDDRVERGDLAPTQRIAIIAEILAAGIRRRRDDARRMGGFVPHQETKRDGLELSGQARPDRPTPTGSFDALRTGESR